MALSRARHKATGGSGGCWDEEAEEDNGVVVALPLLLPQVEVLVAMAPRPLFHIAPSPEPGEALWPPTRSHPGLVNTDLRDDVFTVRHAA